MTCAQRAEYRHVIVEVTARIAHITMNRKERKNALSPALVNEIIWALDDARDDPEVRVVVLAGAGDTFCAGADLSQMKGKAEASPLVARGDFADLLLRFAAVHKPVIAKVQGPALGGGLGLVGSCPFAIAGESALLGTPEILRGLFPMQIMAVLEPLIPRRQLIEMMLLGQTVSASTAASWGLVSHVVPDGDLDEAVRTLALALAERSPTAMRMGLEAFHFQSGKPLTESLPYLRGKLMELLSKEDAIEGLSSFLQKRAPVWTGR